MFEGFTDRANQVVRFAEEEAESLRSKNLGTEHVLLGLIRSSESVAAHALINLKPDLNLEMARRAAANRPKDGETESEAYPSSAFWEPFAETANEEALDFGHNFVGTEHLLLAVISLPGHAIQILEGWGLTSDQIRSEVLRLLGADVDQKVEEVKRLLEQPPFSGLIQNGGRTQIIVFGRSCIVSAWFFASLQAATNKDGVVNESLFCRLLDRRP